MRKKLIILVLALSMLALCACGAAGETAAEPTAAPTAEPTAEPTATPEPTPTPTPTPTPAPTPNASDLDGHSNIEKPKEYLPAYETQYVKSSGGYAIFLSSDVARTQHFDTVLDATEVTVIARQDESALIIVDDGRVGWATASMLEDAPTALYAPGHKDLYDYPDVESPKDGNWLPAYETYYVKSSKGAGIYATAKIDRSGNSVLVKDGTEVTALGRDGTYLILVKGENFAGWVDIDLLTTEKPGS